MTRRFKIVRDKIPSPPVTDVQFNHADLKLMLLEKLIEEATEVRDAFRDDPEDIDKLTEEFADLAEVFTTALHLLEIKPWTVNGIAMAKRTERGGFDDLKVYEIPSNNSH